MHFESTEQSQLLAGNFGHILSRIKRVCIGNWPYFSTSVGEGFVVGCGRRFVAVIDVNDRVIKRLQWSEPVYSGGASSAS